MRAFLETYLGKDTLRLLVAVLAISSAQSSWGDQFSLVPVPPSNAEVSWVLGPSKANLGDFAKIDVPDGYRFTDANGAQILLHSMKNLAPRNVVGLLAPDSGKWWVVLEYSDVGYLKALNPNSRVDAASVLRSVRKRLASDNARRARQGASPIDAIDWAMRPVYDASQQTLEWALRAETRSEKIIDLEAKIETNGVVNHTMRLIGKQYVLDLTAVQPDQMASESIPLKELVKRISFNPGERYTDYQMGDKLAKLTLEELIVGEQIQSSISRYAREGIWVGAGVFTVGIIATGVILIRRKFRRLRKSKAFPDYREHGHVLSPLFDNGRSKSNNGSGRRKSFNYQKFYSKMMLEVSSGPMVLHPAPNGKRVSTETADRLSPVESTLNQVIVRANLELIANQNDLIGEQKRLLQEQGRLIEEKTRLIHEKTRLLEKQAELFERDLL